MIQIIFSFLLFILIILIGLGVAIEIFNIFSPKHTMGVLVIVEDPDQDMPHMFLELYSGKLKKINRVNKVTLDVRRQSAK